MREKLAIPEADWPRAIGELCSLNHIEEAAVLSTCNRMEIYVVALSQHRGVKEVTEWMSKVLLFFMPTHTESISLCLFFLDRFSVLFCGNRQVGFLFRSFVSTGFCFITKTLLNTYLKYQRGSTLWC